MSDRHARRNTDQGGETTPPTQDTTDGGTHTAGEDHTNCPATCWCVEVY